jgi:hypothetical protein
MITAHLALLRDLPLFQYLVRPVPDPSVSDFTQHWNSQSIAPQLSRQAHELTSSDARSCASPLVPEPPIPNGRNPAPAWGR